MISLMTSYYMLVDRVGLAVGVTFLKDGILYSVLPVLGSLVFGKNGMWAAFAVAPVVALIIAMISSAFSFLPPFSQANRILIVNPVLTDK